MSRAPLADDHGCFACGALNPDGLRLAFEYPAPGLSRAAFLPAKKFQGWAGICHGGIVATLLDEAMAHALGGPRRGGSEAAVTAEISIRFKKPVPTGRTVVVEGRVVADRGRVVDCAALLRAEDGTVLAEASGRLIKSKRETA